MEEGKIEPEYVLLGLGAAGLAYYFFVRPKPPPEGPYEVFVKVEGSGPIGGASVYLDGTLVDLTDATGAITIPDVSAGPHTIRASKEGYYDATRTFSVPETTSVTLELAPLPPELYTVTIEVRDPAMVPVGGASVYLGNYPVKLTDASGEAVFLNVPGGLYSVVVTKDGYERASTRISVPATTVLTVTLRILPREPTRDIDYYWDGLNWVCTYCAAASAIEAHIIEHIKAKHPEELGLPPPPPPPEYRCPYCGEAFYTKAELDSHIATVHAIITIGVKVTEEDGTPIARAGVQVGGVGGVWDTGSDGIAWVPGYLRGTTGRIRVATPDDRSAVDSHTFTYDREVFTITVPPAPIEITARAEVTWAPTGEPIPNVRIHFDTIDVRTDYRGRASFRLIKDKPYWVNIDNPKGWTETFYAMTWTYDGQEIRFGLRTTY